MLLVGLVFGGEIEEYIASGEILFCKSEEKTVKEIIYAADAQY